MSQPLSLGNTGLSYVHDVRRDEIIRLRGENFDTFWSDFMTVITVLIPVSIVVAIGITLAIWKQNTYVTNLMKMPSAKVGAGGAVFSVFVTCVCMFIEHAYTVETNKIKSHETKYLLVGNTSTLKEIDVARYISITNQDLVRRTFKSAINRFYLAYGQKKQDDMNAVVRQLTDLFRLFSDAQFFKLEVVLYERVHSFIMFFTFLFLIIVIGATWYVEKLFDMTKHSVAHIVLIVIGYIIYICVYASRLEKKRNVVHAAKYMKQYFTKTEYNMDDVKFKLDWFADRMPFARFTGYSDVELLSFVGGLLMVLLAVVLLCVHYFGIKLKKPVDILYVSISMAIVCVIALAILVPLVRLRK